MDYRKVIKKWQTLMYVPDIPYLVAKENMDEVDARPVIAGLPREDIRGFLRGFFQPKYRVFDEWRHASHVDYIRDPEKTLKACIEEGLCTVSQGSKGFIFDYTDKGLRFVNSSHGKLSREKAVHNILDIVEKAKTYNANKNAKMEIQKIILFGSALTAPSEVSKVGDVDLVIHHVLKPSVTQQEWEDYIDAKEAEYYKSKRFSHNWREALDSAKRYEWRLFLKRRPTGFVLKSWLELDQKTIPHLIIFKSAAYKRFERKMEWLQAEGERLRKENSRLETLNKALKELAKIVDLSKKGQLIDPMQLRVLVLRLKDAGFDINSLLKDINP